MSLDRIEKNTARWTLRSNSSEFLSDFGHTFKALSGINAASLTEQTLNIEVDCDVVAPDIFEKFKNLVDLAEDASFLEVISYDIPNID